MKKFAYSAVATAILAVGSTGGVVFTSSAAAEVSANISIVSDYELRGFSETDGGAAIQGGFDWEHASGFYMGTWASNVDFGSAYDDDERVTVTDDTTYELDLYLGFADSFDNGFGYDVGYVYYAYPDASVTTVDEDDGTSSSSSVSYDFGELVGSVSYDMDVIGFYGGIQWVVTDSASESLLESDDVYFYGGLDVPFAEVYSAGFMVGRQTYDDSDNDDYTHYSASLARDAGEFGEFSLNLAYADVDDEDMRAWVGWSKSF
ncbi:TorF family putative porin [Thioalkalivibrio sp. ALgr3]|uniref:TorF family putative porin n=1 Tax=Thioalkalivibrio sp. ALgr3 TaxID=1239292 RepID=UPI0003783949|nr:TorF family putative porin [Thioalkalivibrio sp. ALgr3]